MKKKPNPAIYEQKKEKLKRLVGYEQAGLLELFFSDECGFSLNPSIPYGWQPIGIQKGIKSANERVVNLFGLLSKNGKLITYATEQNVNSAFIIECINEISLRATKEKPVVIVLDNAPWHKSLQMKKKQEIWEKEHLYLFFLPTYSPHLNLIEILWRKIKYRWLKSKDYRNKKAMKDAIFHIIKNYDNSFAIQFASNFK